MLKSCLPLALFMILSMFVQDAAAQKPATEKIQGKVDWVYDYAQGMQLSKSTGKPMWVVFRCER